MNNLSLLSNVNPDGKDNLLTMGTAHPTKANPLDEEHGQEFEEQLAGILGNMGFGIQMGTQILTDDAALNLPSFPSFSKNPPVSPFEKGGIKGGFFEKGEGEGGFLGQTPILNDDAHGKNYKSVQVFEGSSGQVFPHLNPRTLDPLNPTSKVFGFGLSELGITSEDNQALYSNLLEPSADDVYLQESGKEFMTQLEADLKSVLKGTQFGNEDTKNQLSIDRMPEHLVDSNTIQKGNLFIAQDVKDRARGTVTTENLIRQVGDKFAVFVKDGFSKATIELEPPSMGSLKVDIIVKDNVVRATIAVEHQVVKEVLKANLSSLTDALTHQGFQVSELTVFLGDRGGGFRDGFDFMDEENRPSGYFSESDKIIEENTGWKGNRDGAVDIFV